MRSEVPWEPLKLLTVLFFAILSATANWAALSYIHDFVDLSPLPDVISYWIPQQSWTAFYGDWAAGICGFCLLILIILHQHRFVIFRRFLYIASWLYAMRAITILATRLPPPFEDGVVKCRMQIQNATHRHLELYWHRFVEQAATFGLQDTNKPILCGDLLFSGHTIIMVLSALMVRHYIPKKYYFISHITSLISVVGVICMLISRNTYTVDVIVAYWLASFVFTLYHSVIEVDRSIRTEGVSYWLWFAQITEWLERNVHHDCFENKFVFPVDLTIRPTNEEIEELGREIEAREKAIRESEQVKKMSRGEENLEVNL
ncbi:unnamed protein product [Bursaphelenchus xylophilus]|uniref:(pine wood nematode) hypothetical protein n=1 Tax=Bursaphelenchus xylophilus TaxID=6326 RepID=A0A1I7RUU1_BURXY|nr:unnamed protein product [Bursaphelenchus xylophilus]CAG9105451.1 unnamed protein product [Bursaphelenchus xylophilus]